MKKNYTINCIALLLIFLSLFINSMANSMDPSPEEETPTIVQERHVQEKQ